MVNILFEMIIYLCSYTNNIKQMGGKGQEALGKIGTIKMCWKRA